MVVLGEPRRAPCGGAALREGREEHPMSRHCRRCSARGFAFYRANWFDLDRPLAGRPLSSGAETLASFVNGELSALAGVLGNLAAVLREVASVLGNFASLLREVASFLREVASFLREVASFLRDDFASFASVLRDGVSASVRLARTLVARVRALGRPGSASAPSRSASQLVNGAARLLPAADRGRYQEELHAELLELAAGGATRRAQLAYAGRLAARIWSLRRALREPGPAGERVR